MKSFKINIVPSIMALAIASLSSYAFYSYAECKENAIILAIGAFIMFLGFLFGIMGFSYEDKRNLTMVRVSSLVFFLIALIANCIFCGTTFGTPVYIILNGFIGIAGFLSAYYIVKSAA